jgi:glucose-fructose oxidoreductase
VGLGYISQVAVLPAFAHASRNSELTALASDDPTKLSQLSKKYGVSHAYSYDAFDDCLESGEVDAVYIALPNSMHCEYSIRAMERGIHVLCEKPMAVTEEECEKMIRAADEHGVKLMVAYRLHFEAANLMAAELVRAGKLGEPKAFDSIFSMQVKEGDIRLDRKLGGGTLYDIGIYCINAARHLFEDEPVEVFAYSVSNGDARFRDVDGMTTALLSFPNGRLASFTSSFGAADISYCRLLGTDGHLTLDPAFDFSGDLKLGITIGDRTSERVFPKRDQFAPELIHFSQCVLKGQDPEPSGIEGLADVRVIRALYRSAEIGRPVELGNFPPTSELSRDQEMRKPAVKKPKLIHAESPSGD